MNILYLIFEDYMGKLKVCGIFKNIENAKDCEKLLKNQYNGIFYTVRIFTDFIFDEV